MENTIHRYDGFLPGCHLIDTYGNGGFRFSGMSHRGSILALPSGIYIWNPASQDKLAEEDFTTLLKEAKDIEFLYIGTGEKIHFLDKQVKQALRDSGIRVIETLTTGGAAQTYNILLAENRRVAAALMAID